MKLLIFKATCEEAEDGWLIAVPDQPDVEAWPMAAIAAMTKKADTADLAKLECLGLADLWENA